MSNPTTAKRIAGLTITCDLCPATATHRAESKSPAGLGFDVHWTCAAHTATKEI